MAVVENLLNLTKFKEFPKAASKYLLKGNEVFFLSVKQAQVSIYANKLSIRCGRWRISVLLICPHYEGANGILRYGRVVLPNTSIRMLQKIMM